MMTDNLKNVITTVDVTNKSLRKQYGKVDIDRIERMQELMEVGNEI